MAVVLAAASVVWLVADSVAESVVESAVHLVVE